MFVDGIDETAFLQNDTVSGEPVEKEYADGKLIVEKNGVKEVTAVFQGQGKPQKEVVKDMKCSFHVSTRILSFRILCFQSSLS